MTLDQVIEIVKEHKRPYLVLDIIRGPFDVRRFGVFDCEGCPDNATTDEKLTRAITWLEKMVSLVDDDTQLALTIKPNPKAGKDSWIGPIEFVKKQTNGQLKNNSLAGLDFSTIQQLGFVPAAEIQKKELEYLLRLKDREIEELKRRCEEEKQIIKEQALNWGPEKWEGLVDKAVMAYGMLSGKIPPQLQGLQQNKPLTKEQSIINVINDKLQLMNDKQLRAVLTFIQKLKEYERGTDNENKSNEPSDA